PDRVLYWRDKSGKEIDFVVPGRGNVVDLYECKMNPDNLELDPIRAFRSRYPKGSNFVVSPFFTNPYRFSREEFVFEATSLQPS
ncbi:MAG: ATPase, partial [Gammaproteobacteria bacterium]|nr:ATPase [Gammaproteobacteria bacterium]